MKVAYLGPQGTFSEEAANRYFGGENAQFVRCDSIPEVIEAVGEHRVDKGIAPLENMMEGTINMTIDSLLSYKDVHIEGEYLLPVSLHLLVNEYTERSSIQEVWSIPPIFTQSRQYIRNLGAKCVNYDSSASAALQVKRSGRKDVAAIGPALLADLHGLQILESNIEDHPDNETRFIVVSREEITGLQRKKTMFVITPNDEYPGVLSAILNILSALSINLSWIESRPTARKLGTYRFILESDSDCSFKTLNKAITILTTLGHEIRALGRYDSRQS
ncbi:prephenate dehydratase [Paenibacillus terrigena]|uniref:prephenate dehydratase n=1 Tax=Paenibacillus terrigena TaxID=369333 RepID=UPI0028D467CB|nr:prephenate dehydratase [Paenibacillus terrigena]